MPSTDGSRSALVIATNEYHDSTLRKLRAPATDAERLAVVLADPTIGGFDVRTLVDQPSQVLVEEIEGFFADRRRSDLLLLYFSCHGVKDDDGRLYFATMNTRRARLASTGVAADWVNQQMNRSRSNRVVLLLDCCYSGAFARGMKGDTIVGIAERFDGRGRVILTASNAVEYAFEGDDVSGAGQPSHFTHALVDGLSTGAADRDEDGLVSVDELYDHVYDRVREATVNQTPGKWALGVEGDLYVAQSTRARATLVAPSPAPPPPPPSPPAPPATAPATTPPTDREARREPVDAVAPAKVAARRQAPGWTFGELPRRSVALALAAAAALVLVASLALGFVGVSRMSAIHENTRLDCGSAFMPHDDFPECSDALQGRRSVVVGGCLLGVILAGGAVFMWRSNPGRPRGT